MVDANTKTVIAICDDQEIAISVLKEQVQSVLVELGVLECRIETFLSPSDLLKHQSPIDILFLDIEMPEIDGIEVGYKINEQYPDCKIIMASSRIDRFKEAFLINAIRFITKPFVRDEIHEALTTCLKKSPGETIVDVFYNRINYQIKEKDITYIRAYNGYVEIFTHNKTFRKEASLDELEKMMDKKIFFRIHRQYLINMQHISSYETKSVIVDGVTIPISRRRYSDFVKAFMDFDLGR